MDVEAGLEKETTMSGIRRFHTPALAGFILLLIGAVALVACSEPPAENNPESVDMIIPTVSADAVSRTGLYVYFADSARFTDCASGRSLPVAADAGGLELQRAYMQTRRAPQQAMLVEVIGIEEVRPGMEAGTQLPHLIVEQLIRASPEDSCPQQ
jgi:hypothetical protein